MTADQSAWADAATDMPQMTRRDILAERADLHPDDNEPAPQWAIDRFGGDGFTNEVRALRIIGRLTRCSHPTCRTSLTEDDATFCPHNLPFCQDCTWEDSCESCSDASGGWDE